MRQSSDDIVLVEGNNELNVQMSPIAPLPEDYFALARATIIDMDCYQSEPYGLYHLAIKWRNDSPFLIEAFIGRLTFQPTVGGFYLLSGRVYPRSQYLGPGQTAYFYCRSTYDDVWFVGGGGYWQAWLHLLPKPDGLWKELDVLKRHVAPPVPEWV